MYWIVCCRSKGYFVNDRRDSLWQKWDDKKKLRGTTLYRGGNTVKEDEYYEDGKLRYHFEKKGENTISVSYYPDGKKRRQTEITPDKETITKWDDKGKKDVSVKNRKPQKYYDELEEEISAPIERTKTTAYGQDGEDGDEGLPTKTSSKYDRNKYDKSGDYDGTGLEKRNKKDEHDRAEFDGGEKRQTEYLNLLTGTDRRESTGAFPVQAAVTVSEKGEVTYVKVENKGPKKVKKKYLKEAERIVLMMPKWNPARKEYKRVAENTGFNIWFFEK
ncbi:MAG: hypothetical protein K0S12_1279 [Bacteroidetes bacterium]|nr:hypothetical protein [Bacteroidota bacterium]